MKNTMKRLLCMILVIAMVAGYAAPVYAADGGKISIEQVDNHRVSTALIDKQSVELPEEEAPYAASDVVRVSIVLEKAGTIEAGYSTANIAKNNAAMTYRGKIEKDQASVAARIEKAIKEDLDVVWNLTLAANIISANVKFGQIETIEKIDGVKRVILETRYEPDVVSTAPANPNMATSSAQIGSPAVWGAGFTGAGSRIAVIDTGADIYHEAFDSAAFDYSLAQLGKEVDLMDASDISAVLDQLHAYDRSAVSASDLYVNSKIPFGFNYVDYDLDIVHVNDPQGEHGSHVSGIATANAYVNNGDGTFSRALDTTFVQGVAPDAQLLVMKVFGKDGGAYDADYMAAIEDALILGADSVNLSLGSGNPGMTRVDSTYQDIMSSLVKSGVVVSISAGNSGYWSEAAENGLDYPYLDDVSFQTNGSPGSYTNAFTVASVDNDGFTAVYFDVAGNIVSYTDNGGFGNEPMTTLGGKQEFVLVDCMGELADFEEVGSDVLSGKIVMCYRGSINFAEKANNAASMGAAGVVVVNNTDGIIYMDLTDYLYTVPAVSILQADGEVFKAVGTAHTTASGMTYWTGSMEVSESLGAGQYNSDFYTMSTFSSWGVPGSLELKPEITAPGGNIYSVAGAISNGNFSDHQSYEIMSGTSMAAPQVAGMAALMAQYIRETGLDKQTGLDERTLTHSLLMSTAVPLRDGGSSNYYPVIQQGAGLANVGAAVTADSYITMDADATASWADGKIKAELGDDPDQNGVYSFTFTINNLTDKEQTYDLYADVFTQDAFAYSGILMMDTWTRNLNPAVEWKTSSIDADKGFDFNGDGKVTTADGQILLDYATGLDVTLSNGDKADLNSDGEINSYDAYLFFDQNDSDVNCAVVPANGSAEVTVTITLSGSDRQWLSNFENGTYIQAYIYAKAAASTEGEAGTVHSIPMLAYYGNWSDPSMFDKGSYVEFAHGLENRPPYLYGSAYQNGNYNGMLIKYADMDGEYWFGGNPMVNDETYMPERNALSGVRGDMITKLGFTAIRNAAESRYQLVNTDNGEVFDSEMLGQVTAAYYHINAGYWRNTYYTLTANFDPSGIAEDTSIELGLTLIPEYYVDGEGNVDWNALGDGVTLSMPMVIDNKAPTVKNVDIDTDSKVMTVTASDNQYIAAVALYDIDGQYLYTYTGSNPDQAAGDTLDFVLDLAEVNGPSFLLQVYDYAMNTTTYEINTQIGDTTDQLEDIELDRTSLIMQKGETKALAAVVYPINATNRGVVWSSSNASVVSVDAAGNLTAKAVGKATITATAEADPSLTATCAVEVIDISAKMNAIVWDEDGSIWFSEFAANDLPNYTKVSHDMLNDDYLVSAAVTADGTLFASSLNSSTGSGSMYTIDPVTFEATLMSDIVVQDINIFYADLTYASAMYETGALLGAYGPFVISIDPVTGQAIEIIDQYDSDVVGITTCYGQLGVADDGTIVYQDVVYVILNDGTVIQEIYYGYDGLVAPYMYYLYGERASMDSGVDVGSAWYYNSAYYDGSYLYWSAFDVSSENAVTLYAIDADNTGNVYNMGQFADSVWPVGGLHNLSAAVASNGVDSVDINKKITSTTEFQLVAKEIPAEQKAGGSLNAFVGSVSDTVSPLSHNQIECGEGQVYVSVTAKDAAGSDVTAYNGVQTITYDPDVLTLVDVELRSDYFSVNPADIADADGSVTIGYVDLKGFGWDEPVAYLRFEIKDNADTTVTVTHKEVNDQKPGYVETLKVNAADPHSYMFDRFDVADDFSWAKAVYVCHFCGDEVAYDAEIDYEVQKEATCTEDGFAWYTITYGEEFKVISVDLPATGHTEGEISFTWSEDYSACTASYFCDACQETVSFDAVVTSETAWIGCEEESVVTYTATYGAYTDVVSVTVPAAGHVYEDGICGVCGHIMAPAKPYKIVNVVNGVHVYWNSVEGIAKYGVWRSETGKDGTYKWLGNPTVNHFTDTTAQTGKTYFYKVTCMDVATGKHSDKSEAMGIVFVSTPDIKTRTNVAAGIELGWEKISGATGYAIYRKSYDGTDAWVRVGTIAGNETFTWTDTSVKNQNGVAYKYTIRALAGSDMKTLSGCRNAGRTMVRLSSQVLTSAAKASTTSIKCKWTTSSRVDGYEVRFIVDGEVYKTFTVGNYKTGVKTFTGLKAGQTYTIQVRTYKKVAGVGSFYSDWSAAKTVTLK